MRSKYTSFSSQKLTRSSEKSEKPPQPGQAEFVFPRYITGRGAKTAKPNKHIRSR